MQHRRDVVAHAPDVGDLRVARQRRVHRLDADRRRAVVAQGPDVLVVDRHPARHVAHAVARRRRAHVVAALGQLPLHAERERRRREGIQRDAPHARVGREPVRQRELHGHGARAG